MSEENEMNCAELSNVAAELALGVLTGRERAEAVAHLDRCEVCREDVRQLMATGDELLALLPAVEPPAGFETRVLDRLGWESPAAPAVLRHPAQLERVARRWNLTTRRLLAAAAVLVAIVGAGLGGWGVGRSAPPAAHSFTTATFTSTTGPTAGESVGKIWLYERSPRWLYMSVEMGPGDANVICEILTADGHVITVGSFRLADGYGSWGSPDPGPTGSLRGARLVTANGTVLATATFQG